jgi:hypothetical protein
METTNLTAITAIISVVLALSIASERLVEIIKGLIPYLNKEILGDENAEGRRRAALQFLAVVSGIVTAYLAKDYLPTQIAGAVSSWSIIGLGLLASGGSGLWNSLLGYFSNIKKLNDPQSRNAQ